MSGHSKWHQIKHKKGVTDQKRGQLFSKILKAVSVAARDNPDPQFNPRLRTLIEKAKINNIPSDNIERALKKSSDDKELYEVVIEAYGPEKTALIIEGITDNKNRTIAEIKTILSENGAKMADQGSVLWAFKSIHGQWQAQFPQIVSDTTRKKISELMEKLEAHEDVQGVISNI